jgi:hypothetical protein
MVLKVSATSSCQPTEFSAAFPALYIGVFCTRLSARMQNEKVLSAAGLNPAAFYFATLSTSFGAAGRPARPTCEAGGCCVCAWAIPPSGPRSQTVGYFGLFTTEQ